MPLDMFLQTDRPMTVDTPLGPDVLLLVGFTGHEGISRLFSFHLDVIAENYREVKFDELLGQKVTVALDLPSGDRRFFNGICSRVAQGKRDERFTYYRLEIVPQFWLLSKRVQSRIFQHVNVPDILKKVLEGLDVTYEIQGTFHPRDYCVQYHESDFHFASRLMEEEGIYYFFKHTADGHTMVVANTPQSHPDLPEDPTLIYEELAGGVREEDRVYEWEKVQELRSGKYTLWDHCFELPHKHLEADKPIQDSVEVGDVSHKLKVGGNDKLEIYEFPGEYAQRFDGIDKGGGEQAAELQKIFEDNQRTVGIRMQEEAMPSVIIRGASNIRHLTPGYKFELERHYDANGKYLLTSVSHSAQQTGYESDSRHGDRVFRYSNEFTCIPFGVPYRPPRVTPKPRVEGSQTAVVVGPPGEEIFTDKYSRVKVQFHWDREGQYNADSSCWVRVATMWAGKQWGMIHIPRIDQEVVVDFLEGDPDQPIIVGSVYNADMMPPQGLPAGKVCSGIKSNSTPGGGGYNEMTFDDTKGKEKITVHGQYDMNTTIEHDDTQTVHNDRTITVDGFHTETIKKDTKITVTDGMEKNTVKKEILITSETAHIHVTASTEIKLEVGASKLLMKSDGKIELSGVNIAIDGSQKVRIHSMEITSEADVQHQTKGNIVVSDGTATNTVRGGMVMLNP